VKFASDAPSFLVLRLQQLSFSSIRTFRYHCPQYQTGYGGYALSRILTHFGWIGG
jgi:hypothetical protein